MSTKVESSVKVTPYLELYRFMFTAREIDALEQEFTKRGEAFFHVSGAGHEGTAALAPHLLPSDWLHCHYRDKALMLARGVSPEMFFMGLFCRDGSSSRGRQMCAHLSDRSLNIMSMPGAVGNSALQAAGAASVIRDNPENPIVLCSLGDGMTQQGEVLEAIAHSVRDSLPVLYLIQDNSFAISTKTAGKTFFSLPDGTTDSFYSIPIVRVDGCDIAASHAVFGNVIRTMRETRKPAIILYTVDRLTNHTNADDQRMYRTQEEIDEVCERRDPIAHLRTLLLRSGVSGEELEALHQTVRADLREAARRAQYSADPSPTFSAKTELPVRLAQAREYLGTEDGRSLTMIESLREVLRHRMSTDSRVTLFGEDLEDPKGDVFGVTRGLGRQFPGRVVNSPLSESTILGVSVGQALAGRRPVAFLQFADFMPIAYNQIFAELGSMHWRADGTWQAPVIVMITCGAYKPGLGPFHASSLEAVAVHTPGVDVYMPSTAADAAGMLNAAFESGRPTLFFYPKNCLNDRENATSADIDRQIVPPGKAKILSEGSDITLVGWGNTVRLCRKAAQTLTEERFSAEVIDLRSLSPWDEETVLRSVKKTGKLVVVHEDNHSCGMGAEVLATVLEKSSVHVAARRITRPDTHVPCNFENQLEVLPSYRKVLEAAASLLGMEVVWQKDDEKKAGEFLVPAIGSSPSDESVTVIEWHIGTGSHITTGMLLASLEADKAVQELMSPVEGDVMEILVPEGDMVKVGTPVLRVRTTGTERNLKPVTQENPGVPFFRKKAAAGTEARSTAVSPERKSPAETPDSKPLPLQNKLPGSAVIGISGIASAQGSRIVTNGEIAALCPEWNETDILKRTGIESRHWVADGEDALSLAVDAARSLLEATHTPLDSIGLIVCSTGTPVSITPSLACLIHHRLAGGREHYAQALDISAACSGFLYALQQAYDHVLHYPESDVLVITTETLSRRTDTADPVTAPIFGDAATATLVTGKKDRIRAKMYRPVLSAQGEDGSALCIPADAADPIFMDGPKVFIEAIRSMMMMLSRAGEEAGIELSDIDLIVPHQANQRIINAIRQKLGLESDRVYSAIRYSGNTSSSSIPLCLETLFSERAAGQTLGLCAFGGGFTFGGAIIELC